jgi:hypothetical protein
MKNENDQWTVPLINDANGQKLRTSYKASASARAVPTDYCGNMIYENGVLKHCEKIT